MTGDTRSRNQRVLASSADLLDPPTTATDMLEAGPWPDWLRAVLPSYCTHPFAAHHETFWEWVWAIQAGQDPGEAFVGVWARGGAKSTSAEAAVVALGARRRRRYVLYVCDTQDRADDHVGVNIASMLESGPVAAHYPQLAERRVGKHGNSRGWRRSRVWTADGLVIDAIGLDTAARGVKLEDQRPDLIVVDDIDGLHDTVAATRKRVEILTEGIIPAGSDDVAVLAIQNLITPRGVFARLVSGEADFLRRRRLSGPVPALEGFAVEHHPAGCGCGPCAVVPEDVDLSGGRDVIIAGEPTWAGQDRAKCQAMLDRMGLRAFRRECQHDVANLEGALWAQAQLDRTRVPAAPGLARVTVGVDPSGGDGDGHDEQGIVAVGRGTDGHLYVVADASCSRSPAGWGRRAVLTAVEWDADRIVGEANYGGEMVRSTVWVAADRLVAEGEADAARFGSGSTAVDVVHASRGKLVRAEPVAARYGDKDRAETWPDATAHHVGVFTELEGEQTTFDGSGGSPNRLDALVWAATDLMGGRRGGLFVRRGEREFVPGQVALVEERRRPGGMRCRT